MASRKTAAVQDNHAATVVDKLKTLYYDKIKVSRFPASIVVFYLNNVDLDLL